MDQQQQQQQQQQPLQSQLQLQPQQPKQSKSSVVWGVLGLIVIAMLVWFFVIREDDAAPVAVAAGGSAAAAGAAAAADGAAAAADGAAAAAAGAAAAAAGCKNGEEMVGTKCLVKCEDGKIRVGEICQVDNTLLNKPMLKTQTLTSATAQSVTHANKDIQLGSLKHSGILKGIELKAKLKEQGTGAICGSFTLNVIRDNKSIADIHQNVGRTAVYKPFSTYKEFKPDILVQVGDTVRITISGWRPGCTTWIKDIVAAVSVLG